MPDDLVLQIPVIRRAFEAFNVPVLMEPGMEADDVIATLARRGGSGRGLELPSSARPTRMRASSSTAHPGSSTSASSR